MNPSETITAMSGFTADFFGALDATFTDASMNNSKCDISQSNLNKSGLLREVREDGMLKIAEHITKMILAITFEKIWTHGVSKQRRANKTPINIHKHYYKMELMLSMKARARSQWAYHRIFTYAQERPLPLQPARAPEATQKSKQHLQTMHEEVIAMQKRDTNDTETRGLQMIAHHQLLELDSQNSVPLVDRLCDIFDSTNQLRSAFQALKQFEEQCQRKAYFLQLLTHIVYQNMRMAYVMLHNNMKRSIIFEAKQMGSLNYKQAISFEKIDQLSELRSPFGRQQQAAKYDEGCKPEQKLKFRRASRIGNYGESTNQVTTSQNVASAKQISLKFNRCIKKKNEAKDSSEESTLTPSLKKIPTAIQLQPSKVLLQISAPKALQVATSLKQNQINCTSQWYDFNLPQKCYHLPANSLKIEVPDIQDKVIIPELLASRSGSLTKSEKLSFNYRLHKIDSKKPLEFSNKRNKSRASSKKSRSKAVQSDQEQYPNFQSMKSYYFPESQTNGKILNTNHQKIERPSPTKFIGSHKWAGQPKKKIIAQANLRTVKSQQKANPYLQELRDRISRKQIEQAQPISLHKMIQRSISARSVEKVAKQEKRKQENRQPSKQHSRKSSQNLSPHPRRPLDNNLVAVPREWRVQKSPYSRQLRSPGQFQKTPPKWLKN